VRFRIRPVETSFYDLFTEMANHLVEGANLLAQMLDAGTDKNVLGDQMREAEHQADETTHAIIRRANSTFITPFMEETVDLVGLYELGELPADFAPQVEVLQRATQLTADAMPRLRTMKDLDEYWIEINRLENQGDRSYRRIVANLFSGSYKSLEVMKLKDVVDSLEHAIDALESVANTVEQIAVKES
jgi:uncharacterized protein Yka (UPF0111/DUF47 family)